VDVAYSMYYPDAYFGLVDKAKNLGHVRFEVFTAVTMKNGVF
jgi:hypothetical protein